MSRINFCPKFIKVQKSNRVFRKRWNLLQALNRVAVEGNFLEFGVWRGDSINFISKRIPKKIIYGFDCWHGLPEKWVTPNETNPIGSWSVKGVLPTVEANVKLVSGYFEDTLPKFVLDHPDHIAFVHIDCDLYSSTSTVLNQIGHLLISGSIIVFDEWFVPGCEDKAFYEFLEKHDKHATALFGTGGQMTFKIN